MTKYDGNLAELDRYMNELEREEREERDVIEERENEKFDEGWNEYDEIRNENQQ